MVLRRVVFFLIFFLAVVPIPSQGKQVSKTAGLPMKKYITEQATFVLYMPEGWKASEGVQGGFRTLFVGDPDGFFNAAMFYGVSPAGKDVPALVSYFVNGIRRQFPDFKIPEGNDLSRQINRVLFDGFFTDLQKRRKEFRCWVSGGDGNFTYSSIEAPEGQLAGSKQQLLTLLSNVQIMKGAFQTRPEAAKVSLVECRLHDGSASFQIPQSWNFQSFGTGAFAARDQSGFSSFVVGTVELLTPQLKVRVPGALVSNYLPPHQALQFIAGSKGFATQMEFIQVIPRQDLNQHLRQVYTSGPAAAEEFIYTFNSKGRRGKGYSFGISFGSRLNTNWKLWHISMGAPVEQFDAFVPAFVAMAQSYKVNDQFAQNYIAQGIARLRQLQKQTADMVSRNAREIREMMQSAYDERQKSMEYIDYQRTKYIRGESDWISNMEGGTVYRSDSWGTKNVTSGEYHEGQPYHYFNFTGKNPKYNEQMEEINSRALYEKYKSSLP